MASGRGVGCFATASPASAVTPFSGAPFSVKLFSTALLGAVLFSLPAQAQSGSDAGSPAPEPATPPPPPTAAGGNTAEPEAAAAKTPREAQRSPENVQSWLHDRGVHRTARIARSASSTSTAVVPPGTIEDSRAVRSRRMRSFDEAGITVLSNRVSEAPAPLARVEPARVAAPAPRPPRPEPTEIEPELEQEPSHVTETRSLRAGMGRAPPRHTLDDGFGWATLAAGGSALGLAALWFRRRGRRA